jgi:hypothetical protein
MTKPQKMRICKFPKLGILIQEQNGHSDRFAADGGKPGGKIQYEKGHKKGNQSNSLIPFDFLAGPMGLEPTPSGVTGRFISFTPIYTNFYRFYKYLSKSVYCKRIFFLDLLLLTYILALQVGNGVGK